MSEPKAKIEVMLPKKFIRQVEKVAAIDDLKLGELWRLFIIDGFGVYCEKLNKRLVALKLERYKLNEGEEEEENG